MMFFFKINDIEKKTNDNSFRYITQSEQTQSVSKERGINPNTTFPRKRSKNFSQNDKKFVEVFVAERFKVLR